jgi:uncharacterized RDD family membrane protein YckC
MSQITVLDKSNQPLGPFTRAEVADKLQRNEITLDNLAFVEGLSQWTPLRDVLAKVDGAAAAMPLTPPPAATPVYSYAATMQPPGHLVYAGFWLRFVAVFIDGIIVGIPMGIMGGIIGFIVGFSYGASNHTGKFGLLDADGNINMTFVIMELSIMTISTVISWLYFALMESSSAQGTFGKQILSLKVTNLEGQRIGFGQATGRYFGKYLSYLTLYIGYIMAGFTERKQALHDMLAGTLVVRK